MGVTYGASKHATVVADRVLDCDGSGSFSWFIQALDTAAATCSSSSWTGGPCVVSASLGAQVTGTYQAPITAIDNALAKGVITVVAAGNANGDACTHSPAQAPNAVTVASSTSTGARSPFSNWGACVDVFAPGSSIIAAAHSSDTGTRTMSGTSMAAPHVAGVMGAIMASTGLGGLAAVEQLRCLAQVGTVSDPKGSPNLFLHVPRDSFCSAACPCGPVDECPDDPTKTAPGVCGCGVPDVDTDGDGVEDCLDQCPLDPSKTFPDVCGCGEADTDPDGDGAPSCVDECPLDSNKAAPGVCGCGTSDVDTDGDGTPDCLDQCDFDPAKIAPGQCGCGAAEELPCDECPEDPTKLHPGTCGCGVPDGVDADKDGVDDCVDSCVKPDAACGCGARLVCTTKGKKERCRCQDIVTDLCPADPDKTAPGDCGCGVPEPTDGCRCGESYHCTGKGRRRVCSCVAGGSATAFGAGGVEDVGGVGDATSPIGTAGTPPVGTTVGSSASPAPSGASGATAVAALGSVSTTVLGVAIAAGLVLATALGAAVFMYFGGQGGRGTQVAPEEEDDFPTSSSTSPRSATAAAVDSARSPPAVKSLPAIRAASPASVSSRSSARNSPRILMPPAWDSPLPQPRAISVWK